MFTFEMAVKSMKMVLRDLGLSVPGYATAILKGAFQARLISDAPAWEQLHGQRNFVSHAYDEAKAVEIAAFVRQRALPHFRQWLETLQA